MTIDDLKTVLVLGAGTMGARISLGCALNGYDVIVYDVSEEALQGLEFRHQMMGHFWTEEVKWSGLSGLSALVAYITKSLVDDPSVVDVTEIQAETSVILTLHVAPEDMGRVIGKQGRVANAIRTLLRTLAVKLNKRITLEIV